MTINKRHETCVRESIAQNTIIIGSDATLIAAHVITHFINPQKNPKHFAVFVVPTKLRVKQQTDDLKAETSLHVLSLQGGNSLIQLKNPFQILVCTADVFLNAASLLPHKENIKVIVLDECHHCSKKHPMRRVVQWIWDSGLNVRLLGLTESIDYQNRMEKDVLDLCKELHTENIVATSDDHKANNSQTYRQYQEDMIIDDSSTEETVELMNQFCDAIHDVVQTLEKELLLVDSGFVSPRSSNECKPADWKKYCADRWIKESVLSYEAVSAYQIMYHWYEVMRLVSNENDRCPETAYKYLQMTLYSRVSESKTPFQRHTFAILEAWKSFFETNSHKFDKLRAKLIEMYNLYEDEFRGVVFVQRKTTTHVVKYFIDNDTELSAMFEGCKCIYASTETGNSYFKVSKREAEDAVNEFANGDINLLIATSVAEARLDMKSCNTVIRFDPVKSVQKESKAAIMDDSKNALASLNEVMQKYPQFSYAESFASTGSGWCCTLVLSKSGAAIKQFKGGVHPQKKQSKNEAASALLLHMLQLLSH